jgi:hypothetical protein
MASLEINGKRENIEDLRVEIEDEVLYLILTLNNSYMTYEMKTSERHPDLDKIKFDFTNNANSMLQIIHDSDNRLLVIPPNTEYVTIYPLYNIQWG